MKRVSRRREKKERLRRDAFAQKRIAPSQKKERLRRDARLCYRGVASGLLRKPTKSRDAALGNAPCENLKTVLN